MFTDCGTSRLRKVMANQRQIMALNSCKIYLELMFMRKKKDFMPHSRHSVIQHFFPFLNISLSPFMSHYSTMTCTELCK